MSTESAQNERSSSEVNVGRSSNSGHRNSKSASTVVQESAALSDDESRLRHSKRQKSSKKWTIGAHRWLAITLHHLCLLASLVVLDD